VNVTTNPTADWVARQVTEAFPWDEPPRYLARDRDGIYGPVFKRRLRTMGIRDRPITPSITTPRPNLTLGKDTPLGRPVMASGNVVAAPILGGLHHHYVQMT